jgi:hypothetical protein
MKRDRSGMKQRLLKQYEQALDQRLAKSGDDILTIDEIEAIAVEVGAEMEQALAQALADEEAETWEAERQRGMVQKWGYQENSAQQWHPCQECKRPIRYRRTGDRTIVTMAGEVRLQRRMFYCARCNRYTVALDEGMKLPYHAYTAEVERHVAYQCMKEPYEEAVATLRDLSGLYVSVKEAQRITQAVGDYAQETLTTTTQKALSDPDLGLRQLHDPKLTAYILADGIHTPMRDGYQESKVGCVCLVNEQEKRLHRFYNHYMGGPVEFGQRLFGLAAMAQAAECAKTVALGDGAPWIWRVMRRHFPHAIQILDWYHAAEHLHEVAKKTLLTGTPLEQSAGALTPEQIQEQEQAWVEDAQTMMWQGDVRGLIRLIETLPQENQEAKEAVRTTMAYYEKNRNRMNYPHYLARGFQIGSGEIESGCKQVVAARMKRAGMRWKAAGAKAMGCLRAVYLSHLWHTIIGPWPGRPPSPVATS